MEYIVILVRNRLNYKKKAGTDVAIQVQITILVKLRLRDILYK